MAVAGFDGIRTALLSLVARVFGEITVRQFRDLVVPGGHGPLVERRRAGLIISRARMVAAVFALLTPSWIVIDLIMLPWPLWGFLAALRLFATVVFAILALGYRPSETMASAYLAVAWLLAVPTVFFLVSHPLLGHYKLHGLAHAMAAGYAFLPFVMIAGLSVFPITALEGAIFAFPMLGSQIFVLFYSQLLNFTTSSHLGAIWLLMVLTVVAALAGMSQLHFMIALVNQSSHDGLTGAYTRRIGEELFDLQFRLSMRNDIPFAVAFIDLDHFKRINDTFGHEEGDRTLRRAAESIRRCLRRGDVLIRWGGEEFVILMPGSDCAGALNAVDRLRAHGLGARPDGQPQTASIGMAERAHDGTEEWQSLIEKADQRMYAAKQAGRNRICTCDERLIA
ncbi:MAG: GGDEF domain-containing protein [Rhodospirillales bacterium]|nr:GGDEF domain-containing protein [Rhodospirillales bacterium]